MFPGTHLRRANGLKNWGKYARRQTCFYGDWQSNDTLKIFKNDPIREFFGPKV